MFHDLQRITSHVWVHPPSPDATEVQAAVGIVVGEGGTLLVDAGNGSKLARHIQEQLETLGAPPVRRVVYTHHHWDHVFGAYIYRAPALAHARCCEALSEAAQLPWGTEFLARKVALNSKLAPPLHLRTEDDTFDMAMLASLVEPAYRFYVGGHDEVATFEELNEWLDRNGS